MSDNIRVLLVDDHPVVRAGFQRLLDNDPRIDIIAEASSGQEAVDQYQTHNPDIVIMDLSMPTDNNESEGLQTYGGLEAIRTIRSKDPEARVLVLTVMESEPFPAHVVQAGASGYLTKRCAPMSSLKRYLRSQKGVHTLLKASASFLIPVHQTAAHHSANSPNVNFRSFPVWLRGNL